MGYEQKGDFLLSHLIYTAADGNYALQAKVLLLSLVRTQTNSTHLVVLGNGWSAKENARLEALQSDLVTVEIRSVDSEQFSQIRLQNKFPLATAYNVLAPQYLLEQSGRALYVDADVVVMEDLSDLWIRPMTHAVGAVLDAHIGWVASPSMWRPWREENMDPMSPYLNTGVMLVDLDKWRDQNLTTRIIEVLERYDLPCVDQDAINIVLRGEFELLQPRYNLMPYHYLRTFRYIDAVESDIEIGIAITRPAIVHFHRSFLGKPWTYGSIHPATKLWRSLATSAQPGWQKSIDLGGLVRRRAARFANMLKIDERTKVIHEVTNKKSH